MNVRPLLRSQVGLCVDGGDSFFREGRMPGGFEKEVFVRAWTGLIENGIGTILGSFDGDTITGALGAIFSPNLFNSKALFAESFWYVLPQHRGGSAGIKLLRAFEDAGKKRGAKLLALVHLENLQPKKLAALFERMGYVKTETAYVKELT